MKLKSYFSSTVEAAMEMARKELGDEALLVNARPATPETRYLGAYEVVFGVVPAAPPPEPAPVLVSDDLRGELADLRRQIERLMLSAGEPPAPSVEPPPPVEEAPPPIADQLALLRTDSHLGKPGAARSVVAFVGPPGAGKTTTLIKLAARYGLAQRKRTQIVTADVNRIAAADQLRTLAAILGIPCEVADTPHALSQHLDAPVSRDLILIDTPGFAFREMDDAAELAETLVSRSEIDVHLVLPASMKPADMSRMLDSYAMFHPSKLIFTRLDETAAYESLVREAVDRNLAISFLCTGQKIPDDIEEASVDRLTDLVSNESPGLKPLLRMRAFA
jgi:flagellar biosynthesis protein FlhF